MHQTHTLVAGALILVGLTANPVVAPACGAQIARGDSLPPVPAQIAAARRVFVSNAGAATYGSERYYALTRYDNPGERLYDDVFTAVKRWSRVAIADSPRDADIVYDLQFANPIVDKRTPDDFEYDPQVHVRLLDPQTQTVLWALTEHIEPASSRAGDNAAFDRAAARLVERLGALSDPATQASARATNIPVGATAAYRTQRHWRNAVVGAMVGGAVSMTAAMSTASTCLSANSSACGAHQAERAVGIGLGGMLFGALVGWVLPVK
jgi:hypothetical protein